MVKKAAELKKTAKKAPSPNKKNTQKKIAKKGVAKKTEKIAQVKTPTYTLNSGHKIPVLGFGTCLVEGGSKFFSKVVLEYGYRHLDTAMRYGNEEELGEALQDCFAAGIKRKDLFITTKLDSTDKANVEAACRTSLKRLQLDYVDLYLIHWMKPEFDWNSKNWKITTPPHHVVWKQMEALVKKGLARSIGVSNCTFPTLCDILADCKIRPAVNQVECHPYFQQTRMNEFHQKFGIYLSPYGSIGSGQFVYRTHKVEDVNVLTDPVIKAIATSKGKTPAQIVIRWHLQRNTIPLVKTSKEERLRENSSVHDFQLTKAEMARIDGLDAGIRLFNPKVIDNTRFNRLPYFD